MVCRPPGWLQLQEHNIDACQQLQGVEMCILECPASRISVCQTHSFLCESYIPEQCRPGGPVEEGLDRHTWLPEVQSFAFKYWKAIHLHFLPPKPLLSRSEIAEAA